MTIKNATLFSDRFLYVRMFVACLLLWASCVYSKVEGEVRYPSYSMCVANPFRFSGTVLYFRSTKAVRIDPTEAVVEGKWEERMPVRGSLPTAWLDKRVSFVADFVGPQADRPAHLRLRLDPQGRPIARLERAYVDRRVLMYGSSAALFLLWIFLFRREFEVRMPKELVAMRKE